jgi:capsular polysaccharide export protein
VFLPHEVNVAAVLERANHVYTCTSDLGFEALLRGKKVTCFGVPFYAGWGLTDDRVMVPRRNTKRSLDELCAATLLVYPRYLHPVTRQRCSAEVMVEHLALQRRMFEANQSDFLCVGFTRWKRPFVRRYLGSPDNQVHFLNGRRLAATHPAKNTVLVRWASRPHDDVLQWANHHRVPVWNMEDGFLRSVGLGSNHTAPGSLVVDQQGIYYDPTRVSGLEHILQSLQFSSEELQLARQLRQQIVEARISKYNPHGERPLQISPQDRRVIFVPGQVEDDASVLLGGVVVHDNGELLNAVRAHHPTAFILYKPHPDVSSGNRQGDIVPRGEQVWDQLVTDVPIDACLAVSHEVHTMTSLVGFEALLRELPVVTYGQPFYAGWGLTSDRAPLERRTRRLSLDELVAGTLLRYPRYFSWSARSFCTASDMVSELARLKAQATPDLKKTPRIVKKLQSWTFAAKEWVRDR